MELANQLKIHRLNNGYSQIEVANKLNLSRQSISKWENGRGYPDIDNLILLSELYKVSIDELIRENQVLQNKINTNKKRIKETTNDLNIVKRKIADNAANAANKDEGILLLILVSIASFIFPLGLILGVFTLIRNKKGNSLYKIIYLISIFTILINVYDGYTHLANYMNWGTSSVEKVN